MRIISKLKDYYDGSVLYSPDPVWVRNETLLDVRENDPFKVKTGDIDKVMEAFRRIPAPSMRHYKNQMTFAMVCVCGTMYVVYSQTNYLGRPQDVIAAPTPSKFVKKWNDSKTDKNEHISLDDERTSLRWYNQLFNDKEHNNWVFQYSESERYHNLHRTVKSPIFMVSVVDGHPVLTINPHLVSVGFQVVIDPWTMVQSLERYVGNDLVDTPLDGFTMTDELKRDSKGMDEWSFKQRGPKARKRKKG